MCGYDPKPSRQLEYAPGRCYRFALTFAHRARCAAAIFLRAARDIIFFFAGTLTTFCFCPPVALTLAHRARCAAAIRALAAVLSVGRLLFVVRPILALPRSALIAAFNLFTSFCSLSRSDFKVCKTFMYFSAP
jgi:hypothetical protein